MNTVTDREYAELRKMMVETDAIIAQMRKMNDEREKLRAETLNIQIEAQTFKLRHALAAIIGTVVFLAALKDPATASVMARIAHDEPMSGEAFAAPV